MFIGKRDLNLAPNELVGLQMTILRILAFLPRHLFFKKVDRDKFRDRAISGERDNNMVQSSASDEKTLLIWQFLGKLFRK